jgi:HEAT repeat protein
LCLCPLRQPRKVRLMRKVCMFAAAMFLVVCSSAVAEEPLDKLIARMGTGKKDIDDEIVRRGDAAVKPVAALMLDDKANPEIRIHATMLLGKFGGKGVEPLKGAVASKDRLLRFFAVLALGEVGPAARDAVPELARALRGMAKEDNLKEGRHELIETLGKIGGKSQEAVDALVLCMEDQRCHEAAYALTKFGKPGAEALITLSVKYATDKRPHNERRYGEVYLVSAWGSPSLSKEMIPVFKKHFETGDRQTRRVAGLALAGVGKDAIPVLAALLDDKDPDTRLYAADALVTMNWFARRAAEGKGGKVEHPVSSAEFFPKFKKLYKSEGKVDKRMLRVLHALDEERFMADEELVKAWVD